MKEINEELSCRAKEISKQLREIKKELYAVLVQDEYLDYFSHYSSDKVSSEEDNPACDFVRQIKTIYYAIGFDGARLARLSSKYHRSEYSLTVAYEQISDEAIEKLRADDIVTIYLGEIYAAKWGGVWEALFGDPFFLKSLKRLKAILEKDD